MKKFTLLIVSMLMVTLLAMAQIKFIVYKADGSTIELLATEVDSIGFVGNNEQPDILTPNANGHEYVDLGLPSGTLWATMNVGADSPEDYGDYFAWSETEPKEYYYWNTYKWYDQENENITKYCTNADYGLIDNRGVIELSDDAARINWGGSWRIPTKEELLELWRLCDFTWTTQNGVAGYKVASRSNGNSIFLPAAGFRILSSLDSETLKCRYWSSTISKGNEECAFSYSFDSVGLGVGDFYRNYGLSIRPVLPLEYNYTIKFDANGGEGKMASDSAEYATLITLPENMYGREGYEFVGWNTNADGSGNFYKDSQTFSVSSDITLYAQWKKIGSDNEEGKLPETPTGFMAPGEGKIRFSIDATAVDACYGLGIEGNFCGYDPNTAFKGTEFGQNMFYIDIPSMTAEEFGNAKILLLNEDGHSDWAYQVSNESYDITASEDYITLVDDYGTLNAINLISDNIDNVVIKIAILAVNDTPCKPDVPAGFAKFVLTVTGDIPEGKKVIFTGNFGADNDEWGASTREMTKQADGTYVWEGAYPENFQFKAFIADCEDLGIIKEELWLTGGNFKLTAEDGAVINFLGCFDEFCPVEEAPAE